MTTTPVVELRFNPTDLRPRDLPPIGAFLGSPADAIEAGLSMVRARMVQQLKAEVRGITEPTSAQILRLADMAWQLFLPQYRKVSAPVMADAYVRAYRAANAGDVPMSVIYDLAEKHAEKVGDYFHESSRVALADGFNTMVNRQIPAKAAADRVLDAYGLTQRQMRGYTSAKQLQTPVENVSLLDVKGRARKYVDRSFTSRIRKLSAQEEHNIEEQAKQFAWMWLQDKGRLTDRAQKMWITAKDERVCRVCGPLHGKKVLVNQQFKTKEGAFWSPGLHPNCRCVVRLIENRFQLEKRFDPHQPRDETGRWSGGQSRSRRLGTTVNALESPSAKVIQGTIIHRTNQAVGYLTEPRYLITPLKHRDKEMARVARGAAAWSRKSSNVARARQMADPDNEYYAHKMKMSGSEKALKSLITAVESAPKNSPELYRGMVVSPDHLNELKPGSTFRLPMSSFTESEDFSEHFARKWGPMIARAHAKREGTQATGVHPVVMVLEPKANALNISPLVAERQAEWITRGEFLITQVGEDNGLTVVHLRQTSNRSAPPRLTPRKKDKFSRVGFTGTLKGMTPEQKAAVRTELSQDKLLSHGSAVGADEQAAAMAHDLGMYVVANPADDVAPEKVSDIKAHLKRRPQPALDRNQAIVDQTDRLVAAPRGPEKSYPRSGTWATIRRARKAGKPIVIVMPDGTVTHEVAKADWNPKEHPRGGDPENKGRFSRAPKVLEREQPLIESAIWESLQTPVEEPEEKLEMGERTGTLSMGSGSKLQMGHLSMGNKLSMTSDKLEMGTGAPQKLEMGTEVESRKIHMSRSEALEKLEMLTTPKMQMAMERTFHEMTMVVPPRLKPAPRKRGVYEKATLHIQDDNGHEYPVYAVVKPGELNWRGEQVELTHQVPFTPSKSRALSWANEAFDDQVGDALERVYENDMPTHTDSNGRKWEMVLDDDQILEVVNWASWQSRAADPDSTPDYDFTVDWVDTGGNYKEQDFQISRVAKALGVKPGDFEVRIMRMDEGHDSQNGTTVMAEAGTKHGYEDWVTSGRYNAVPIQPTEIRHNLSMKMFWIDPDVQETFRGFIGGD